MFNENKTSTLNKVLTIIAGVIAAASTIFISIYAISGIIEMASATGENNLAGLHMVIIIAFSVYSAIANAFSTIISIVAAINIKKREESKKWYNANLIIAILPWVILVVEFVASYLVATGAGLIS